jgi:hypothetical protein
MRAHLPVAGSAAAVALAGAMGLAQAPPAAGGPSTSAAPAASGREPAPPPTAANTRFFPAYPGYDWGILAGWAWSASRVADYLERDGSIDPGTLIITGASRHGKSAMIAAAFDDRLLGAPVVTGGGHGHAFTSDDWMAMLDVFDTPQRGKPPGRTFDRFPTELTEVP